MKTHAVVDKISEDKASILISDVEVGMIIPIDRLPAGCNEGDWLQIEMNGDEIVSITLDPETTGNRKESIKRKMEELRKRMK
jgi:hypothetical protein